MASLNQVTLIGRLARDPELKTTTNSAVTQISVATTSSWKAGNDWKEETQWHNVVLWGDAAKRFCGDKGGRKGDLVMVLGDIRYRKYQDKEGKERTSTDIHASKVQVVSKNTKGDTGTVTTAQNTGADFGGSEINDDLPF